MGCRRCRTDRLVNYFMTCYLTTCPNFSVPLSNLSAYLGMVGLDKRQWPLGMLKPQRAT
jgi:hypothetical protein